jgi:hypothetical protein
LSNNTGWWNYLLEKLSKGTRMTNSIYATVAALVFFCLLALVQINETKTELLELKKKTIVDCKFNKGTFAHTWKNACVKHADYIEIIQ